MRKTFLAISYIMAALTASILMYSAACHLIDNYETIGLWFGLSLAIFILTTALSKTEDKD